MVLLLLAVVALAMRSACPSARVPDTALDVGLIGGLELLNLSLACHSPHSRVKATRKS